MNGNDTVYVIDIVDDRTLSPDLELDGTFAGTTNGADRWTATSSVAWVGDARAGSPYDRLFEGELAKLASVTQEQAETERGSESIDDDDVRCAACGHRITSVAYRIEMNGAHEHTFVNPGGFVHHVGCYAAAPGCVHVGNTESAFTWFPGWSWQIAACGQCRAHLGWVFRCTPDQFHALIVDALRSS